MKKIKYTLKNIFNVFVLSLILILSSFAFCFASVDNYPSYGGNFSSVENTKYFMKCGVDLSSDSSNPTHIFNNIYAYKNSNNRTVVQYLYNNVYTTKFTSTSDQQDYVYFYYYNGNLNLYPYWSNNIPAFGGTPGGQSTYYISGSYIIPSISIGSSVEWIGPSINTIKYPYTFQNGYLFVFDLGSSGSMYSFDLTSKSEEYSNIGDNPFPNTNQSFWFDNSLPEVDETTIPSSSAITIHWDKGDKTNIFGQTQDMKATINGTSSGRYLYIYNPPAHYKWSGSSNPSASETINYPVTINGVSSGDNFYIYDSRALLYDYNQGGKVQGTITGETGYGSVSTDGAISVVTSDGAIYNQNSGGSTDISGANGGSISENINGLKETLDNFVNQFIQLLSAPISHIQQLIQSSHEFFDVFSQLFEWLPSDLSSVIVSGLIIMVVIGVIKMLL